MREGEQCAGTVQGRTVLDSRTLAGSSSLRDLREVVPGTLECAGIDVGRRQDIALAVHEIATNTIIHGGGWSRIQIWIDDRAWNCDVVDGGPGLADPSAGTRPPAVREGGFGLWIARHAADEFHIVPTDAGLHVRLVVYRSAAPPGPSQA